MDRRSLANELLLNFLAISNMEVYETRGTLLGSLLYYLGDYNWKLPYIPPTIEAGLKACELAPGSSKLAVLLHA